MDLGSKASTNELGGMTTVLVAQHKRPPHIQSPNQFRMHKRNLCPTAFRYLHQSLPLCRPKIAKSLVLVATIGHDEIR